MILGLGLSLILATATRGDSSVVNSGVFAFVDRSFSLVPIFLVQELLLCPAALPAILPVRHQELEAERINLQARLKANAQIAIVHLVNVGEAGK